VSTILAALLIIPGLMPAPRKAVFASGKLAIDSNFSVAATAWSDARLQSAMNRLAGRIARQTGVPLKGGQNATLAVECRQGGSEYPSLGEDESYELDVTPADARLKAATVTGALRGLETFAQLITPGPDGFEMQAIHIEDQPRFLWRGLLLDVARHWMPVPVVKRNLDGMAAVKLNVLHWHLSDDQDFTWRARSTRACRNSAPTATSTRKPKSAT
jgi:hexosaminidase